MPNRETLYNVADRIATITLNRPDKLNAWTAIMEQEVRSAIEEAERDENVRVIILTGAGRGFCAGADMSLLSSVVASGVDERVRKQASSSPASGPVDGVRADFRKKYSYFPAVGKPVIAAVNGPVVGLGLVIALYCDLRFASDASKFSTAFARRGLIAEYGLAWILPRLVGHANALDLLFSARMVALDTSRVEHGGGIGSHRRNSIRTRRYVASPSTSIVEGDRAVVLGEKRLGAIPHV